MEIFAFEMYLQICIYIFTVRTLEDETCCFSKKTKIALCFCIQFSILASLESVISTLA